VSWNKWNETASARTPQGVANEEVMIFNHNLEWKWKVLIRSKSNLDEWILFLLMRWQSQGCATEELMPHYRVHANP
jgi:hypothetical protein